MKDIEKSVAYRMMPGDDNGYFLNVVVEAGEPWRSWREMSVAEVGQRVYGGQSVPILDQLLWAIISALL